jgi:hypothetical protein
MLKLIFEFLSSDKHVKIQEDKNDVFCTKRRDACSLFRFICIMKKCKGKCLDPPSISQNLRIYNLNSIQQVS